MDVLPIPCLRDNYAYVVAPPGSSTVAIVDPSEAAPVWQVCECEGYEIVELWLTHHHWDHVGGIEELLAITGALPVRGSTYDQEGGRIPGQTEGLSDGDRFGFGGSEVQVITIPGHTLGAIAYVVDGHLFSGDTLFLGGCGRIFEGTVPMMKDSLARLRELPDATQVWCGHEYTVRNLEYAQSVEPRNTAVVSALERARARRGNDQPTVPGTIGDEKQLNPFFRYDVPEIAAGRSEEETFRVLREGKDVF